MNEPNAPHACCADKPTCCRSKKPAHAAALVFALLIAGLLGFTAYAKAFHANPKPVEFEWTGASIPGLTFDRAMAGFEVVVLVLALLLHRKCWAWALNAMFFAALAGYGAFKSWHGEACGCFAQLFDPGPYVMASVDIVIVVLSLAMAAWLGLKKPLIGLALIGVLAAGAFGWAFSDATTPPRRAETAQKHEGRTAVQRLIESPAFEDIRAQPEGGPAWLIFCFDPTCHICEAMKPLVDFQKDTWEQEGGFVLRAREYSIPDLQKDHGIETHAWETPTLFVYADGKVTRIWTGNQLEDFPAERLQEIYDKVASGEFLEPAQPGEDGAPKEAPAPKP